MKMSVKEAMSGYFDRLLQAWRERGQEWPITPWDEDVDPIVYVGEPDESEMIQWRPVEKSSTSDLEPLEAIRGAPISGDLHEYFNSYWFCAMGGRYDEHAVQLEPVLPGAELDSVERNYGGYVHAHDGERGFIPIGFETGQGRLLVIDASSGEVLLEDYDTGKRVPVADGLETLITRLRV
jgi:SecY interacting protein Syd